MSRSKITSSSIQDGTLTEADWGGNQLSHRNLIINGDMRIAQRGTSYTINSPSSGVRVADRWNWQFFGTHTGSNWVTLTQETDAPDGFSHSSKITTNVAQTGVNGDWLSYALEAQDTLPLKDGVGQKDFTVSFWVKSNVTGNMTVAFENVNYSYSTYVTIQTADTWEYKTATFPATTLATGVDYTLNTSNSSVKFGLRSSGSWLVDVDDQWNDRSTNRGILSSQQTNFMSAINNYVSITGVQLEVGSVATPFEHRSYGEELARCQRYYHRNDNVIGGKSIGSGFFYNSTVGFTHYDFPVEMRTAPSKSFSGLSDFRVLYGTGVKTATDSETISGRNGARLGWTVSGATTGQGFMVDCNNSTGWIAFDAEL